MRATLTEDELRGLAVRWAREYRGLSIGQLATKLGWHRNTLAKIEGGERHAKDVELHGIASVLVWPVGWLEALPVPELDSLGDPGQLIGPSLAVRYLSRMSSLLSPRSALVLAPSAAAA